MCTDHNFHRTAISCSCQSLHHDRQSSPQGNSQPPADLHYSMLLSLPPSVPPALAFTAHCRILKLPFGCRSITYAQHGKGCNKTYCTGRKGRRQIISHIFDWSRLSRQSLIMAWSLKLLSRVSASDHFTRTPAQPLLHLVPSRYIQTFYCTPIPLSSA